MKKLILALGFSILLAGGTALAQTQETARGAVASTFTITQQAGLRAAGTGLPVPAVGVFPAGSEVVFTVGLNGETRTFTHVLPEDPGNFSSNRLNGVLTAFAAALNGQSFGGVAVTATYEVTAQGVEGDGRLTISTASPVTFDTFTILVAGGPGGGTTSINFFASLGN